MSKVKHKLKKPLFLYHSSPNSSIRIFDPRAEAVRDPKEGPVVFATPSEAYASMFIVRAHDDWSRKGTFNGVYYIVINDKDRFLQEDKGGSIYVLPSETFETDEIRNMGSTEWVSKVSVKPLRKIDYTSGLEAMLEHGVQVYFVNKETWQKIIASNDHGLSILSVTESENQKRGLNVLSLQLNVRHQT